MLDNFKNNFKNKKILILGLGREGLSSYQFLKSLFPQNIFGLADQLKNPPLLSSFLPFSSQTKLYLGKDYLKSLKTYDLIIKSPGIPLLPEIVEVKNQGKLTSPTKIFFENCQATIIGITGTKGKGTTTSLIYQILDKTVNKQQGKKPTKPTVYLAGNIGKPMLPLLRKIKTNDWVVLELSSHQLEDLDKSPHIAVFLNLFPEHLDRFSSTQAYFKAKANIFKFQSSQDYLVYNAQDRQVATLIKNSRARKISFSLTEKKADLYADKKYLYYQKKPVFPISLSPLIGEFNLQNIMAAIAVAKILKIPNRLISQAIKDFKPLPHRLELVGTFKGITFYNDSQATHPRATIAALQSLKPVTTLIAGGYDRGGVSYEEVGRVIAQTKTLKTLILFPTTGRKIWRAVCRFFANSHSPNPFKPFFVQEMKTAVQLAYQYTPKNTLCLLSPSSASFGIFKDYADRGNQFKSYVKSLGIKKKKAKPL